MKRPDKRSTENARISRPIRGRGRYAPASLALWSFAALVWFIGGARGHAAGGESTQAVLEQSGFREGLIWIGTNAPLEVESRELLGIVTNLSQPAWRGEVESFLLEHPASPWAASLHHAYASFCRRTGRTTKALTHWEAAWALVKADDSDAGRRLGGAVLANWTELLSSLGRLDTLGELTAAGDAWPFVSRRERERFLRAKDNYYLMQFHPGIAYRCGTLALKAAGQTLQPTNRALESLVEIASPSPGFSLAALAEMAAQRGLPLVARRRIAGTELLVPAVIHWRQNHYAALLAERDGLYLVSDPTFGEPQWFSPEVINEEASGAFLVPQGNEKAGWSQLTTTEAQAIHGKGLPNNVRDGKDKRKKDPCKPAGGMPVWWVSEPYINLWMEDEPVSYRTSRGEEFPFRLTYKQRDTRPDNPYAPDYDPVAIAGWNHNWFSFIAVEDRALCVQLGTPCKSISPAFDATVYLPGGGEISFANGDYDSESRSRLEKVQPPSVGTLTGTSDNGNNGLRLIQADGSQDIYGFGIVPGVPNGDRPHGVFLLTRRIDPHGNTTRFVYETASVGVNVYRLKQVIDYDGRTNHLRYTTTFTTNMVLTEVENPYGKIASFAYDHRNNLTNLVDAAGLVSSLQYNTNDYPTALITPYGTNRFEHTLNTTNTGGDFGGHDLINRAVRATEPTGGTHLYLYRYDSTFMPTNYAANDVPTNTPLNTLDDGSGGTNGLAKVSYRNSFYWSPRQSATLSTTNLSALTGNDYLRGRLRHWLQDTNELYLSGLLSVERAASPDGVTEGLKVFHDYEGKIYPHRMGTHSLPSVTAWRLPGGETHYQWTRHNEFGFVTNEVSTYSKADGTPGLRTNQYVYEANTYTNVLGSLSDGVLVNTATNTFAIPHLLVKVIGADGGILGTAGGHEAITWTNDFKVGGSTNRVQLSSRRLLPRYLTNAVNEVTELAFAGFNQLTGLKHASGLTTTNLYDSMGFLSHTIDLEIGRTNAFGYTTNGMLGAFTNDLGLTLALTWDDLLRLTGTVFPDGSYSSNRYDKLDLSALRDRLGNWTYAGYDRLQRPTAITNANNAVTRLDWCGCGALESITDALTNTTLFYYDNQGRQTNVVFADGSSRKYFYDLAGRTTNVMDGLNRAIKLGYNNQGLLTTVSNAYGLVERVVFDALDRAQQITDANGVTVTNTYDLLNRITKRTWMDGFGESYGYSTNGLIAHTNRNQQVTRYTRDAAGRLTAVTNANTEVTRVALNSLSQVTDLWDGLNHNTHWNRDSFGRVTNKLDALNREVFRFAYNANGQVTNRWTPQFGNTGYAYDLVGNLTNIVYPSSSIAYAFNALSQLTNMVDSVGTHGFGYTQTGRLKSEDGPWADDTVTLSYTEGLRTAMSVGSSWSQNYGYDSAWRMTSLASPAGSFSYGYGAPSTGSALVRTISLPNFATITNHYDSLARLDSTALKNRWGHTLDGASYTHDRLGLRTNITRDFGLTTSSVAVGYDNIGQLTKWTAKEANNALRLNEQLGWNFDAAGNLNRSTNGLLIQTFTVDPVNELTNIIRTGPLTVTGNTPAPATNVTVNDSTAERYGDFTFARTNNTLNNGNNSFTNIAWNVYGLMVTNTLTANLPTPVTLTHDLNGNLTNDGLKSFAYDAENQLVTNWVAGQWKTEFVYDGFGRRRITRDYGWQGGAWVKTNETRHVCDALLPIQERDANNATLVTYTRGLDLSGSIHGAGGIGGLLARTDANGSAFYHADGSGNITALMDGQGDIVARYLYHPFGKLVGKWGLLADANVMRFSSKPEHRGIVDFGFRWEIPDLNRWTSPDPIGERGGINLYGFVGNNPISYYDADGRIVPLLIAVAAIYFAGEAIVNAPSPDDFENGNTFGPYEDMPDPGLVAGTILAPGVVIPLAIANELFPSDPNVIGGTPPLLPGSKFGGKKPCPPKVKSPPKPSPKFQPPTNPPQLPPANLPPGYTVWRAKPTQQYPNGYWKMTKSQPNGGPQPINPSTMKPAQGGRPDYHVEFPNGYKGPFDN